MGKVGASTSGVEMSGRKKARIQKARRREEKGWQAKAGPVTVRYVCPECGGPHPRSIHDGVVVEPPVDV